MLPLFAIYMPANARSIYEVLFQIAAFDMIPTDEFYKDMHENLDEEEITEDSL